MKKNPESTELAAKIAAAAKQPAGTGPAPVSAAASPDTADQGAITPSPFAPAKAKNTKANEPDTVPITLRPRSSLWNSYVLKAAERTREEGRVVSAQQMMLEALERVPL